MVSGSLRLWYWGVLSLVLAFKFVFLFSMAAAIRIHGSTRRSKAGRSPKEPVKTMLAAISASCFSKACWLAQSTLSSKFHAASRRRKR